MISIKIASLFAGAGGLDLGFQNAGFEVIYANEFDKKICPTYKINHKLKPDNRDIRIVDVSELPKVDGLIGGPPCQSWSAAGAQKGIKDPRGQLFFDYIRILRGLRPEFFLCENVPGILFEKNNVALSAILESFKEIGYSVVFQKINAKNFGVAQDRERVIFFGSLSHNNKDFFNNLKQEKLITLKEAIGDLQNTAIPALAKNKPNPNLSIANHEYFNGDFSSMFMSRNRVRKWDEQGFTVQASGRQCQLHPQAPPMVKISEDKFIFNSKEIEKYRRLTVRECARLQGFPDDFIFQYNNVDDGYKMIGNAVPVKFAFHLAEGINNYYH